MTTATASPVLRNVLAAVRSWEADPPDAELLVRFGGSRDEEAFRALLRRHGPLVFSVCRRVLGDRHDSEDAFQATFLVLARKAHTLRRPALLGNWLYGVAYRTALKARTLRARRRVRERAVGELPEPSANPAPGTGEIRERVDREVNRLPERYRAAVVLCELQGRSRQEAARQLRVPEGTLSSRLAAARKLLARRLAPGALPPLGLARAVPPARLLRAAAQAATAGPGQAGPSGPVLALTQGVLNMLWWDKVKTVLGGTLLALVVLGLGSLGLPALRGGASREVPEGKPGARPGAPVAKEAEGEWQDVLRTADPDKHTVGKGIWRRKKGALTAYPAHGGARLRVPVVPTGDYEIRARWEPKNERSSGIFLLPHGDKMASVELLGWLSCSGLGDLNGVRPHINETKRPLALKAGQVYKVSIRMHWTETQIHVLGKLDGRTFLDWEGKRREVDHDYYAPGKSPSLGLAVDYEGSVFHSLELRVLKGEAKPWVPEVVTPGQRPPGPR